MDHKYRMSAKKAILDTAQRDPFKRSEASDIPPLGYRHLEIVDPEEWVDESLIKYLDDNALEGGLTDELFFDCLEESPDYLAYEPFRKRIKEWQRLLNDPATSKDVRRRAKAHLLEIGKVLSRESLGRPPKWEDEAFILWDHYSFLKEELKPFLHDTRELSAHGRIREFKKKFPYWSEYADALRDHRTPAEIAKAIMVKKHKISKRHLLTILKTTGEMLERTPTPDKRRKKTKE